MKRKAVISSGTFERESLDLFSPEITSFGKVLSFFSFLAVTASPVSGLMRYHDMESTEPDTFTWNDTLPFLTVPLTGCLVIFGFPAAKASAVKVNSRQKTRINPMIFFMNDASRYYTLYTEILYHNIELNSIFFGHYGNNNE